MNNSLIDILIAKFQVINTQVVTFDNVLSALSNIMTTAQTSADTAKGISPDISGTFEGERAILNELNKTIGQSSLIDSSLFSTISHDIDAVSGYMNSISSIYNDMGYNIDCKILKACDYGVPQMRKRLIFMGIRTIHLSWSEILKIT